VNTDSLSLVSEISRDQLKLGKLQNQLEQYVSNKQNASEKVQSSADKNSTAAEKLSNNPDNRKLARKAKNTASDAKRDSRNARSESDKLDKLNKDIDNLKDKIASNQVKLNKHLKSTRTYRIMADSIPYNQ
jgi:DNA repair ATPase RecN